MAVPTIPPSSAARQADLSPQGEERRGELVSLALMQIAVDESGWKHEAIAAALKVSGKYFSRMLTGEKPWTMRHVRRLPGGIERRFVALYAEYFGFVVIEPVDDAAAKRHLAIGLFGVLTRRLPDRAEQMAKASVKPVAAKASLR